MSKIDELKFNDAELQVIERMAMAFELAVTDGDPEQCDIETRRAIALIDVKENPQEFINNIITKAGSYNGI